MYDSATDYPKKLRRNLVFTSAGDQSNIIHWCAHRNFDLWIYYYGDHQDPDIKNLADYFCHSKGGKMQNFYTCLNSHRPVVEQYESILLADDDIVITGKKINQLFEYLKSYNVKALQPAADPAGKVSYSANKVKIGSSVRYVNFLEIGFTFFETQALLKFMEEYSPVVNCWGVDWWYSYFLIEHYGKSSLAIIDTITYFNPYDFDKADGREIEKLSTEKELATTWEIFQKENNIITEKGRHVVYCGVNNKNLFSIGKQVLIYLRYQFIRVLRRTKRLWS